MQNLGHRGLLRQTLVLTRSYMWCVCMLKFEKHHTISPIKSNVEVLKSFLRIILGFTFSSMGYQHFPQEREGNCWISQCLYHYKLLSFFKKIWFRSCGNPEEQLTNFVCGQLVKVPSAKYSSVFNSHSSWAQRGRFRVRGFILGRHFPN